MLTAKVIAASSAEAGALGRPAGSLRRPSAHPPSAGPDLRFRLWTAQVLSVRDRLARVALTLLVFQRTGSALLGRDHFAVSIVPAFVGGLTLSGLADGCRARQVMIAVTSAGGARGHQWPYRGCRCS